MKKQDHTLPLLSGETKQAARHHIRVEFDGGTPCNIPRLGYGDGYGSYVWKDEAGINATQSKIVRVNFARPMSCNVAEVCTLLRAIDSIMSAYEPSTTKLSIYGDSKIALNRCNKRIKDAHRKPLPDKFPRSPEFIDRCDELLAKCAKFHSVETCWRGRDASVKLFGH